MKDVLSLDTYNKNERVAEGNRYLIGNGHLGYRGVLLEEGKEEMKGFNIVGIYDQYEDKWRESLNLPDPLSFKTFVKEKEEDILTTSPLQHSINLHLNEEIFERLSEFQDYSIRSERFISFQEDNLLAAKINIKAKKENDFRFLFGLDTDIFEINGPHFKEKEIIEYPSFLLFKGKTNEGKNIYEGVAYLLDGKEYLGNGYYEKKTHLKEGEEVELTILSLVFENEDDFEKKMDSIISSGYENLKKEHLRIFTPLYNKAKVKLLGDMEGEFEANYSIYSLLILGDKNRARSIPARGVSGQTYKGAIFWDSEIFLLPFFIFNEPEVAKNLIRYRINTINGAKSKAKEFGYEGAFYAWESQEDGLERCSKYNVTDYKTGKPIRTYFNEKQIHISADIVYAFENYIKVTGDTSLLAEGGIELLVQCSLFFASYATKRNGKYHLDDVIGPDEYHERVNDNAFTNYMAHHAARFTIKTLEENGEYLEKYCKEYEEILDFYDNIYLPKPNDNGVIPQFEGYLEKEDCSVDEVRSRLKDPKQYWGGEDGPASGTQVIKQADVVALLVLLSDEFDLSIKKANYNYYFPRTEHGSSLSSSMYSLLATEIGEKEYAYEMFRKSASIDLYGPQKMFAGGIYIGGTHPASAGGAYMSLLYGFSGLKIKDEKLEVKNHLPKEIKELTYSIYFRRRRYRISIGHGKETVIPIDEND